MTTTSLKLNKNLHLRARFIADAQAAREQMLQTGTGFDADEVHEHLKAMVNGKKIAQPKLRPWRD
ncbi:MAG: hypothetical protein HQL47_05070 [Gammaproteobacteria bacterium]|nr:hypothetical protein [Gammaproteobacteria bacterium]